MIQLNFDFKKLLIYFLPSYKRRNIRVRWLYALLKPLRDIHAQFISHTNEVKEEMKWNGQLIVLQRYLQLRYGSGITIQNQDFRQKINLGYPCPDERNLIAYAADTPGNPIAFSADQGFVTAVGFIVKVPSIIIFDEDEMRAVIDFYQIGSSDYEIKRV